MLHPRKLSVYTLEAVGGKGANASYHNLVKAYEHALGGEGGHFTSYNMTHGGFGGVSRDLICVQSMDGRLQVRMLGVYRLCIAPVSYATLASSFDSSWKVIEPQTSCG